MSIENLSVKEVLEHDVIILAGGDILNDYFMTKLVNLLEMSNFSGSVYAFSSGIPYADKPKTLKTIMDIFDGVMVRSRRDYEWCKTLTKQVMYHPDVSIFTEELLDHTAVDVDSLIGTTNRKRILLTVAQPFYVTSPDKEKFLESICNIIRRLINEENGHVYMVPFNTYISAEKECDFYFQDDIMKHLGGTSEVVHVTNVSRDFSMEEMIAIFKSMHLGVHMRYHAHMLSIITGLPFVSLGKTPKTLNLMADLGLLEDGSWSHIDETTGQHYYEYGKIPDIDIQRSKFAEYTLGYTLDDYKSQVHDWVQSSHASHNTKRCPLYTAVLKAIEYLRSKCKIGLDYSNHAWVQRVLREPGTFAKIIKSYSIEDIRKEFMASLVCYYLIGTPFPEYHYGLSQKILGGEFMASRELQWIYNDYINKQYQLSSTTGLNQDIAPKNSLLMGSSSDVKLNLTYVNVNDFNGLHRSGWPFVMASMSKLHDPDSDIIFDNYVDRTFHWCHDIYAHVGLIPYKKPWVGVLHHTMNEEYSEYNTTRLLNNPTFIESLQTCKGLIVLSDYLKSEITPLVGVPVVSIKHPTDLNVSRRFDIDAFQREPAVVQVGAWLRNNYSIYALTPTEPWLKKKVLRGKNMNHHFCPDDLRIDLDGSVLTGMTNLCISSSTNKFITGMMKHLQEQYRSVHEISTLSNDEYDTLLTNHIVFLDLVDVSAANTVIECIARYTPLVINRHPAVVEYLGESYPLFYDSIAEANTLVCDMDKIHEAHMYLRTMYKGDLRCEHFVYQVSKFVSVISTNDE